MIKELSSYSVEAMFQAGVRTNANMNLVNEQIGPILTALKEGQHNGLPTKKRKTTTSVPSADEIFSENILPVIRKNMEEIEEKQRVLDFTWQIDFTHDADFDKMSMPDLIKAHCEIQAKEKMATRIKLVLQYQRGMLYISAKRTGVDFEKNLDMAYSTARRYMTLAVMIKTWPMLLVCNLSFAQITKHKNRLCEALKKEPTLDASLNKNIVFKVQGTEINIQAFDGCVVLPTEKIKMLMLMLASWRKKLNNKMFNLKMNLISLPKLLT